MINRLNGLGHNAIISRHDKNNLVCHLSSTGTHRSKRLMPRGIKKHDFLVVDIDDIRSNMLRNAPKFRIGNF